MCTATFSFVNHFHLIKLDKPHHCHLGASSGNPRECTRTENRARLSLVTLFDIFPIFRPKSYKYVSYLEFLRFLDSHYLEKTELSYFPEERTENREEINGKIVRGKCVESEQKS